jgi:uncharacterized membrane protein
MMRSIEKSIDVDVPVSTAYNQWTQFEEFPFFMDGIKEVQRLDDSSLCWRADVGGREELWTAEIVDNAQDQRLAWRSTSGANNSGEVTFRTLGPGKTRIHLTLHYEAKGAAEHVGDFLGVVSGRVSANLERFKEFIEHRWASGSRRQDDHRGEAHP